MPARSRGPSGPTMTPELARGLEPIFRRQLTGRSRHQLQADLDHLHAWAATHLQPRPLDQDDQFTADTLDIRIATTERALQHLDTTQMPTYDGSSTAD